MRPSALHGADVREATSLRAAIIAGEQSIGSRRRLPRLVRLGLDDHAGHRHHERRFKSWEGAVACLLYTLIC